MAIQTTSQTPPQAPQSASSPWLEHVEATEGWLSLEEAKELHALAADVREGVVVEVGSYHGRSTIALSAGAPDGVPVFAVDPHEPLATSGGTQYGPQDRAGFYQAMLASGSYRNVRLLNASSEIITPGWTRPVGFLWIDGDHSAEAVVRDWNCWQPHLVPGCVVAFDDAHDPAVGPYQLIQRLIEQGVLEHRKNVGKVRTLHYRQSA